MLTGLLLFACSPDPAFIRAPFQGVTNEAVEQVMDATTGGVLLVGNGTEIHVPANAFVNQEGQPVTGDVKVAYTAISDPGTILISGIPLNYGNKENPSVMQSAAMFDLSASANGQELELSQGKSIRTVISSNVEGDQYDFFALNKEGKTWDKLGTSEPTPNPLIDSLNNSITDMESKSVDYDLTDCFAFNYGYDLDIYLDEDRAKLKDKRFNYYTWETSPAVETLDRLLRTKLKSYGVTAMMNERVWKEVDWNGEKRNPNLLLWKSEKPLPNWILNSKTYRNPEVKWVGKNRYRVKFLRWEYENNEWKQFTDYTAYISPKMALSDLYENQPEERSAEYEALLAKVEEEKVTLGAQNKVLREFNISKMGVYNYDYIKEEERLMVAAEIYLDGEKLNDQITDLFVMIKDQNAVLRYDKTGMSHFVIYPGQQLFAFMVVDGNGIAMEANQDLNNLDLASFRNDENKTLRIDLKSTEYKINRPIDLTEFLDREMNGISTGNVLSMN
ncbi:MAG: hypothetical protein R8G66_34830 [Cytophagales bacterium]|nr:hypothetical protein [Cytophagales bacterium]